MAFKLGEQLLSASKKMIKEEMCVKFWNICDKIFSFKYYRESL